jgi:hypothetical protein
VGLLRWWLLSVTVIAASGAAAAGAGTPAFRPCPAGHLVVKITTGGGLPISLLGVSHLSCARALEAVHAGSFALTPAYPIFSTPGFHCTSPIGPPRAGPTRYVVCRKGQQAFRFHGLD